MKTSAETSCFRTDKAIHEANFERQTAINSEANAANQSYIDKAGNTSARMEEEADEKFCYQDKDGHQNRQNH